MRSIILRHNMEVSHRLYLLEGKCEQVHGHSMWVDLEIFGTTDRTGIILPFGDVKQALRHHMDTNFDHHCLLNEDDPIPDPPGAVRVPGDPNTENLALWIGVWAQKEFVGTRTLTGDIHGSVLHGFRVKVEETAVNAAVWTSWAHMP